MINGQTMAFLHPCSFDILLVRRCLVDVILLLGFRYD